MRERLLEILGSPRPILMAIVGEGGALAGGRAVRGGADLVQVRAKQISSAMLMRLVREVIAEVGDASRVIVNSRPDIAERAGAAGVHLPESGLDPREVRRAFPRLIIGVSRHDRAGLERAVDERADYALIGPVFETPGKEISTLGFSRFVEVIQGFKVPILAVGGMSGETAGSVVRMGARGVAAIRPFAAPEGAKTAALSFRTALDTSRVSLSGG